MHVTVTDVAGTVLIARTGTGITSLGNGQYGISIANWDILWGANVIVDDGTDTIAGTSSSWLDPLAGNNTFSGDNTVTFIFHDGNGDPVAGVFYTVLGVGSAVSDGSGQSVVNLPSGAFTVDPLPTNSVLFPSTGINVSGSGTFTITGSVPTAPPINSPTNPSLTVAYFVTRDNLGNAAPNVTINFKLIDPRATTDYWSDLPTTATSDDTGLLQIQLPRNQLWSMQDPLSGEWSAPFKTVDANNFMLPVLQGE